MMRKEIEWISDGWIHRGNAYMFDHPNTPGLRMAVVPTGGDEYPYQIVGAKTGLPVMYIRRLKDLSAIARIPRVIDVYTSAAQNAALAVLGIVRGHSEWKYRWVKVDKVCAYANLYIPEPKFERIREIAEEEDEYEEIRTE